MLTNLSNELEIVLSGGSSIMEHPGEPLDRCHASIWFTSVHDLLMQAPLAKKIHIDQCDYDAASRKPTVLRGLGVPGLADGLHAWRLPHRQRPHAQLGGWDAEKKAWKTASAKEYPVQLSKALTFCLLDGLYHRITQHGVKLVDFSAIDAVTQHWFLRTVQRSSCVSRQSFLPDYQPRR